MFYNDNVICPVEIKGNLNPEMCLDLLTLLMSVGPALKKLQEKIQKSNFYALRILAYFQTIGSIKVVL